MGNSASQGFSLFLFFFSSLILKCTCCILKLAIVQIQDAKKMIEIDPSKTITSDDAQLYFKVCVIVVIMMIMMRVMMA
jgi:uncharacterized membrane protein YidH (DUF202 family)